MTREVLAGINEISSRYFDKPEVYLSIMENGRHLGDARFLHGVLQIAMEKSYPRDFFSILDKMTELKDTVPEGELQAYYETVLLSYTGFQGYRDDTLSSIKHLLEKSLLLAEDAIRKFVRKVLEGKPYVSPHYDAHEGLIESMMTISSVLGEEGLLLLLPALSKLVKNILWLVTLLTRSAGIDLWRSEIFLARFCAEVLDPAIDQLEPFEQPAGQEKQPDVPIAVRKANYGDCTVTKEELELLIESLKDLGLEELLHQLFSKMAQFDAFRGVLGEEKAEKYGKKRKAVETEGQNERKKGRLAVENEEFVVECD
jgi:hypothetical protein